MGPADMQGGREAADGAAERRGGGGGAGQTGLCQPALALGRGAWFSSGGSRLRLGWVPVTSSDASGEVIVLIKNLDDVRGYVHIGRPYVVNWLLKFGK